VLFEETWKLFSSALNSDARNPLFRNLLPQAEFLCGPEIKAYMMKADDAVIELETIAAEWKEPGQRTAASLELRRKTMRWIRFEIEGGCRTTIATYLDFSKWR
jgi:hypothetical protein